MPLPVWKWLPTLHKLWLKNWALMNNGRGKKQQNILNWWKIIYVDEELFCSSAVLQFCSSAVAKPGMMSPSEGGYCPRKDDCKTMVLMQLPQLRKTWSLI